MRDRTGDWHWRGLAAGHVLDFGFYVAGSLESAVALLFQCAENDRVEPWVGTGFFARCRKPAELQFASEQLVKDHTERKDISAVIDVLRAFDLFRRHVSSGTELHAGPGQRSARRMRSSGKFRHAEV